MADDPPHISIAAGITVGLVASFVQSLGLTIQRLSHVANERLPVPDRKRDWQRPLWLFGFSIFILSNVFGTLFQIGALPIVVLGPLGAVSLLWNALFARVILGDEFSVTLVAGTILIAGGAVLIGIFGVVPEQTHTLPELVALYRRAPFVLFVSLLAFSLLLILAAAHLAEWRLSRALRSASLSQSFPRPPRSKVRLTEASALLVRHRAIEDGLLDEHGREREPLLARSYHPKVRTLEDQSLSHSRPPHIGVDLEAAAPVRRVHAKEKDAAVAAHSTRTKTWLAVAYGATSGTLSGLCLLFTKTGIELLILTVTGRGNQFGHVEPWIIIAVLLICELCQLSYLNRALRLAGPTLICPLAFCFYNSTSIASGLIYYAQVDALSPLQGGMVGLGCAVLLAGVWVVSVKSGKKTEKKKAEQARWTEEPQEMELDTEAEESEVEEEEEPVSYRPRGFSVGLGAASPGFEIRPAHHVHRAHTAEPPSSATFASFLHDSPEPDERTPLAQSTASLPPQGGGKRKSHHSHKRNDSLSGAPYVGPPSPGRGGHGRSPSGDFAAAAADPAEGLGLRQVDTSEEGGSGKRKKKGGNWLKRLRTAGRS
ncbi:hypothetical protein JCM10213_008090 [Rhodosporidiobolus nylandii]